MAPSMKWAIAGLVFASAGLVCAIRGRHELEREARDAETWRETVKDVSGPNESSSSASSQPDLQSSPTEAD